MIKKELKWLKLPHEESDHGNFHGRNREVTEIINTLYNSILITITGKSGVGKTSLIRAGLFPKLREENFFPVYIRLKLSLTEEPLKKQIINAVKLSAEEKKVKRKELSPVINEADESLWEFFHRNEFLNEYNQLQIPIFVLDQLEELFDDENDIKKKEAVNKLFEELSHLCSNRMPKDFSERNNPNFDNINYSFETINYKIILSLRDDYLIKLTAFEEDIPALKFFLFFIQPLNGEQAIKIIRKVEGLGFSRKRLDEDDKSSDNKLAEKIVRKISNCEDTKIRLKQIKIKPAILSVFMGELHVKIEEKPKRILLKTAMYYLIEMLREESKLEYITPELIDELGTNIIDDFYFRAMRETSRKCTHIIERKLVTSQGKRRLAVLDDDVKISKKHLTILKQESILNTIDGEPTYVEYAHDVLLEPAIKNRKKRHRGQKRTIRYGLFLGFLLIMGTIGYVHVNRKKQLVVEEIEKEMSMNITLNNENYCMGMYEVTQKQFSTIMGYNPSIRMVGLIETSNINTKKNVTLLMMNLLLSDKEKETMLIGDDFSVRYVSWNEAKDFIKELNKLAKKKKKREEKEEKGEKIITYTYYQYDLPTFEQWKCAAEGGRYVSLDEVKSFIENLKNDTDKVYSKEISKLDSEWTKLLKRDKYAKDKLLPEKVQIKTKYSGSDNIDEVAWYFKNSHFKALRKAKLKPNGYGLYDMSGNLWEWCLDENNQDTTRRIIMGGSYAFMEDYCVISGEILEGQPVHKKKSITLDDVGFRLKGIKIKE